MTRGAKFIPLFVDLDSEYGVPAQFLYALAGRESRWNPRKVRGLKREGTAKEVRHRAVGLMQITKGVVDGYNKVHGTTLRKRDMLNAKTNATLAAWYISRRVLPRMSVDWKDARSIALIAQAWNSGPGGTVRILKLLGLSRPTVDDVRAAAQKVMAAGEPLDGLAADKFIWLAVRKTKWVKAVARDTLKAFADPSFTRPPAARLPGAIFCWLQPRWHFQS